MYEWKRTIDALQVFLAVPSWLFHNFFIWEGKRRKVKSCEEIDPVMVRSGFSGSAVLAVSLK
jgi:hypothetical protein